MGVVWQTGEVFMTGRPAVTAHSLCTGRGRRFALVQTDRGSVSEKPFSRRLNGSRQYHELLAGIVH